VIRLFAHLIRSLGESFLWAVFLKITEEAQIFYLLISVKSYVLSLAKMGWATFWAMFSRTHLVTLVECGGVDSSVQ
jgi:hypothetical protein